MASMGGRVEVVKLLLALPGIDYNHTDNEVRESGDVCVCVYDASIC
jgi:hypothetical protein